MERNIILILVNQIITVSLVLFIVGAVLTYLAKLPMLGDAYGVRLAYLTSLLEVYIQWCTLAGILADSCMC